MYWQNLYVLRFILQIIGGYQLSTSYALGSTDAVLLDISTNSGELNAPANSNANASGNASIDVVERTHDDDMNIIHGIERRRKLTLPLALPVEFHTELISENLDTVSVTDTNNSIQMDIISSCDAFIDLFSKVFANYSKCAVLSARPLQFCNKCIEQYVRAKSVFEKIMTGNVKDAHGLPCGEMILNADRIQIIVQAANFVDKMWNDCDCSNCFQSYGQVNGTVVYQLSNKTEEFQRLYGKAIVCFQNYSHGVINPAVHYVNITNSSICLHCNEVYDALNLIYTSIQNDAPDNVCMDTVDAMNFTRLMWSRDFKCRRRTPHIVAVMLLTALFCLLPIVFYTSSRWTTSKVPRRIITQKRMKNVTLTDEFSESLG